MFQEEVWAIIHNRFKDGNDLRWQPHMTAADWWLQGAFGDPYATDETMIADGPVRQSFWEFLKRLHMAYAGNDDFFEIPDERTWYNEWILPFNDPLNRSEIADAKNVWTPDPDQYFNNFRYYIQNEAPSAFFHSNEYYFGPDTNWEWRPTPAVVFQSAINKTVI